MNPLFRFSNNDQYLINNNNDQYLIKISIWPSFHLFSCLLPSPEYVEANPRHQLIHQNMRF